MEMNRFPKSLPSVTLSLVSMKDNRPVVLERLLAPQQKVVGVVQLIQFAVPLPASQKQLSDRALRPEISCVATLAASLPSFVNSLHCSAFRAARTHTRVKVSLAFRADFRDRM